jgi:hypothetical protein
VLFHSGYIGRCRDCGRLYRPRGEDGLCRACYQERHGRPRDPGAPEDEYEAYFPSPAGPESLLQEEQETGEAGEAGEAGGNTDGMPACSRCRRRPREEASPLCFTCRFILHKAIADAAREIEMRPYRREEAPHGIASVHSLLDSLEERRGHTGTSRIDPSGRKIKAY